MSGERVGRGGAAEPASQSWLMDTHAHLAERAFDADRADVLARSAAAGVQLVVVVGDGLESSRRAIDLARAATGSPAILATVGIHPHDASQATPAALAQLRRLAADPQVVAVGETGLDFYRLRSPREAQLQALEAHLTIADEVDKPVVVHDRDAHAAVLAALLPWAERRRRAGKRSAPGVLHCFSGDLAMAQAAVAAGFAVSFAGNVTYTSASALADVARQVDLDAVVLETDSPYLTPSPLRGQRNEPANVLAIARRLAELRGESLSAIARRTAANARRLFGLA